MVDDGVKFLTVSEGSLIRKEGTARMFHVVVD